MKNTNIFVLIVLVLILVSNASADLVAHYKFDGDATDSYGNGHHGTEIGSPIYDIGMFDQAINLDGVNDANVVSKGSISHILLISVIAIGVGFFVAMAMVRIIFGFPMAYLLAVGYTVILILSFFTPAQFVPVAFDSGGVTTGPVAVPVILALGIGFSSVLAGKSPLSDGFGLIGLASIGPVIGVMVMGVVLY